MKKLTYSIIITILVSYAFMAHSKIIKKDTFVFASYATLNSLDPAVAYDSTGYQRILNIYETLIFFKDEYTDNYKPVLATEVPSLENGGISPDALTYTFEIKKGVKFHNGEILTPDDVIYSFKRNMIADPAGGPMWMLLEALTGHSSTRNQKGKLFPEIFNIIDKSIEIRDNKILFHLPRKYPPLLSILAHSSAVILNKKWAIENGCWDGFIKNAHKYNKPHAGQEPLQKIALGTGAYKMKSWTPSKNFIFERFDEYWGKSPLIKTAIFKYVKEWSTRKLMLQNRDADRVTVDSQYINDIMLINGLNFYKVPQLSVSGALFCQAINPVGNPNIYSGKLDGKGIPPDFFSDINVRKAFLHGFDHKLYIEDVFNNMIITPKSPIIENVIYHKEVPAYEYDLDKAAHYMKKAFNGKVWEMGFKMIIVYNSGNEMREVAALMISENIMSLNPKFVIEVRNVEWKDYIVQFKNFKYPLFIIGWSADYSDPHNFIYNFMHSQGNFSKYMAYNNKKVDELCEAGIATMISDERRKIYYTLQNLWYKEAPGILLYQNINLRAYQKNINGFIPNSIFTDDWEDLKSLWKN